MKLDELKLSELIRLALADLLKVERDKRYVVNMGVWHIPNGVCQVCMAGAVIAKTLGINYMVDDGAVAGEEYWPQYAALNDIRLGDIDDALQWSGERAASYGLPHTVGVTCYETNRLQWRRDMFKITRMLEKEGL